MAVELQWSLYATVVLFSVHAAHSPKGLQGFSCLNDFVSSITCTLEHSTFDGYTDCWMSGVKITYEPRDSTSYKKEITQSCKLKQHGDSLGCTFSFDKTFNPYEKLTISMTCNGTLVEIYKTYRPKNHIKMHPPGTPTVNSSADMTRISWTRGSPLSEFFKDFNFQVQIKRSNQSWNEVNSLSTQDQVLLIRKKLKGLHQVRVRVKPYRRNNSHWSDWSPSTSWVAADTEATSQNQALNPDQYSRLIWSLLCLGLAPVLLLVFYRLWRKRPVPNPSKYFHTLHSVHGGNLKKWLNPLAASESFFEAHPREDISAVEVCDTWDVLPSTSPCSSSPTALLHFTSLHDPLSKHSCPVDHLSSSSSSGFSNMGYFISSNNSSSAETHSSPYFSYQGNVLSPHKKLPLSLCPSFNAASTYESLRRVPQSPDSGFGFMGKFDEQEDIEDNDSDDNQCFPLLLHLPSVTCFPLAPPPHAAGPVLMDNQVMEMDEPMAASPAASENLSAWPVTGSMCRASSLPVDPCRTGYLTLKELQTTFSNKSI